MPLTVRLPVETESKLNTIARLVKKQSPILSKNF